MKWKNVFVSLIGACWVFVVLPRLCRADVVVEYETIKKITSDISTEQKRSAAIGELVEIVAGGKGNMMLRVYAARKLGGLRATEAKEMLKDLAENLDWSDRSRELKDACALGYWQIRVSEEPNDATQEQLLMNLLWGAKHPPPRAGSVRAWAVDELANRGVEKALPDILKVIRDRYSGERAERRIWLCRTKIELLTTSSTRLEALIKALHTEDITPYQWLTRWAVGEIGKLRTEQSRTVLKEYALELQNRYYDEKGKWKGPRREPAARHADEFYRTAIRILRKSGMSDEEIKAAGLKPDKLFIRPP